MRRPAAVLACLLAALAATACGRADRTKTATGSDAKPGLGVKGSEPEASHDLGFPAFATKNTTRIGGAHRRRREDRSGDAGPPVARVDERDGGGAVLGRRGGELSLIHI